MITSHIVNASGNVWEWLFESDWEAQFKNQLQSKDGVQIWSEESVQFEARAVERDHKETLRSKAAEKELQEWLTMWHKKNLVASNGNS